MSADPETTSAAMASRERGEPYAELWRAVEAAGRQVALTELRRVHRWLTEVPDDTAPPTTADVAAMVAARIDLLETASPTDEPPTDADAAALVAARAPSWRRR